MRSEKEGTKGTEDKTIHNDIDRLLNLC